MSGYYICFRLSPFILARWGICHEMLLWPLGKTAATIVLCCEKKTATISHLTNICRENGLRLGFQHSHTSEGHHKLVDGFSNMSKDDVNLYWVEKVQYEDDVTSVPRKIRKGFQHSHTPTIQSALCIQRYSNLVLPPGKSLAALSWEALRL